MAEITTLAATLVLMYGVYTNLRQRNVSLLVMLIIVKTYTAKNVDDSA